MTEFLLIGEPVVRLGFFLGVLLVFAFIESFAPRRPRTVSRYVRWPSNLGVAVLNTVILRVLMPASTVGVSLLGVQRGWGMLNQLNAPEWFAVTFSVLLLDFSIYLQHVLFHAVPVLWRVHRMHHTDVDFDVTTGVRFHPFEVVLSMAIKVSVVLALGAPPVAVLIFEVALNATSMFNHGNIRIPYTLDRILRSIIVTPDMHRVHHSIRPSETNSNFGFNLSWWDRLLGTYCPQPEGGHESMTIGISQFRKPMDLRMDRMLLQPFGDGVGEYAINRRTKNNSG